MKAQAGNRSHEHRIYVRNRDDELRVRCQESLDALKEIPSGLSDDEIKMLIDRAQRTRIRHKVTLKLEGSFDKIVVHEPPGIPVIFEVYGKVNQIKAGNSLSCKGEIIEAYAENSIFAGEIKSKIS